MMHRLDYFLLQHHQLELQINIDKEKLNYPNFLKKNKYKGKVVFDLLANNGINDRFYFCMFDGKKIVLNTLSAINELNRDIEKISSNFYLSHFDIISNSYISKQSKFLIKKKLSSI